MDLKTHGARCDLVLYLTSILFFGFLFTMNGTEQNLKSFRTNDVETFWESLRKNETENNIIRSHNEKDVNNKDLNCEEDYLQAREYKCSLRDTYHTDSMSEGFNCSLFIREAVEKRILFQAEFCSCDVNDNSTIPPPIVFTENPLCVFFSGNSKGCEYNDCRIDLDDETNTQTTAYDSYNSKSNDKRPNFICLTFNRNGDEVKVIASCPSHLFDSEKDKPSSITKFGDNTTKTNSYTILRGVNTTPDVTSILQKCQQCLSSPETTNLITSTKTGLTYCNRACLDCNEPKLRTKLDGGTQTWQKEITCKTENISSYQNRDNSVKESDNNNGNSLERSHFSDNKSFFLNTLRSANGEILKTSRLNSEGFFIPNHSMNVRDDSSGQRHVCKANFIPPDGVNVYRCVDSKGRRKVNDCDLDNFKTTLDNETRVRLKFLCRDLYTWPVYTRVGWYKNIFCYICENHLPMPCGERISYHDTGLNTYLTEFSLAMLTDFTDDNNDDESYDEGNDDKRVKVFDQDGKSTKEGFVTSHRLAHFPCPTGFWDSFLTNECVPVMCSQRFRLINVTKENSSTSVFKCEDIKNYNDLKTGLEEADIKIDETKREYSISLDTRSEVIDPDFLYYALRVWWVPDESYQELDSGKSRIGKDSHLTKVTEVIPRAQDADIDKDLVEFTRKILFGMNVTKFLISVSTVSHSLHGTLKYAIVYFTLGDYFQRFEIEKKLIRSFSNVKFNASVQERTWRFQSVLSTGIEVQPDSYFNLGKSLYLCNNSHESGACSKTKEYEFIVHQEKLRKSASNKNSIFLNIVSHCPHIELNMSLFKRLDMFKLRNKELNFQLKAYLYDNINFTDDAISVCVETLEDIREILLQQSKASRKLKVRIFERLLTVVCLSSSVLGLILTFITYLVFPVLRTKPGQNNMCLIFWLSIAQTLILLNQHVPRHTTWCVMYGMITQYAWLVSWCWMGACSVHMFLVFVVRRTVLPQDQSHRGYLFRATLVCNGLPALNVMLGAILSPHLIETDADYNYTYGGQMCFLRKGLLMVITMIVPFITIIAVNTTLFTITVVTVSRIKHIKRQAGRERRNIRVYLCLSSLSGLTWVLALVPIVPGLETVRYASILFNGSQGVVIFLCYTCSRRVRKMWTSLLFSRRKKMQRVVSRSRNTSSRNSTRITNV